MLQHWQDGTGDTTKLIVVTDEALYAQSLPVAMAQRQVEELAAGKSPATVFGADATHVVLRSVVLVVRLSPGCGTRGSLQQLAVRRWRLEACLDRLRTMKHRPIPGFTRSPADHTSYRRAAAVGAEA